MNYLAHSSQGSTSSKEHPVVVQAMHLHLFDSTKYLGPKSQTQAFINNGEMYMDDESDYQSLTANNSNGTSYEHFQHQSGMGQTIFANPGTVLLDTSTGQAYVRAPPSSLDMFKSSVGSYLASSGSTTSENSSKSLTSAGVSSDEPSASRTSSQDLEGMTTSGTAAQQRSRPSHEANQPFTFQSHLPHEPSLTKTPQFSRSLLQYHQQPSQGILMTPLPRPSSPSSTNVTESLEDIAIRRAEQNRAAQRAFRQRKQKYIKWLESKADELDEVYRVMALVRTENQQLCNLVMDLNARLNSLDPTKPKMSPTAAIPCSGSAPLLASLALSDTCKSISALTALKSPFARSSVYRFMSDDRPAQRPDVSLGCEISMSLKNLASFPRLETTGERETAIAGKLKYQPQSVGFGKGCGAKGKMAFKPSQQFKQQHQKQGQQQRKQHPHQHKRQQKAQLHLSSREQTPTASSPKRIVSPLPHLTPNQQNQLPVLGNAAPIDNIQARIQSSQRWSYSPRSSMPTTPASILGAPEDVHIVPLAFLPPSAAMSANMATTSLHDTIMPLSKTSSQPQHQPLLQNGSTTLFYGVATTTQQDLHSTVATQGTVVTTSAPEQFPNVIPIDVTSLNLPSHGYSRLGQGSPLLHHHHPYANAQPHPIAHVISQQQLQQQHLQHQQLPGLVSMPVCPNVMALQSVQLSWTEEEEELSGSLQGRRLSMPTLHMNQFQ